MRHENTVPVLIWLYMTEYYLPQFLLLCLQGNFPHYYLFVPGEFKICCPCFGTEIYCWYSVMVHPSIHKTPNYISGDVLIFGKFEFVWLVYLSLVAGVLLYATNLLRFYLVALLSCTLTLLMGPLFVCLA